MDKSKLKIVVIDDSISSLKHIKLMLKKIGLKNITIFQNPLEAIKFIENENADIVFIDYFMSELNGIEVLKKIKNIDKTILTIMITNINDEDIKMKAIKEGINEFLQKNIDFPDFMTKINTLINLRLYYYQIKSYKESLEETIKYKDKQEKMTLIKQYKIISDYVSNHFYDNWIADSYFKPFDIVSGDSYITLRIDDNHFFVAIVDGMGKGLSASLSSVLTISFIQHSISKSIEFSDYNFERTIKDTFNYVKSILLEYESLSFLMLDIDISTEKLIYSNFGMPPLYIKQNNEIIKIKPNNTSLLQSTKTFNINTFQKFDAILTISDGLIESVMKNGYPYFTQFKTIFKNSFILSDILKDFKEKVEEPNDDITIFYLVNDKNKYNLIYSKKITISKNEIENIVNNIEFELPSDTIPPIINAKIVFVLNELLLNLLEHSVLKMKENKQNIIKNDTKIEYNNINRFATINIYSNKNFVIITLEDKDGKEFEINDILKKEWFDRYHGRGIKMLKKLTDGLYYNTKGNRIKVYLKKDK